MDATRGEPVECSRGERGDRCCSFIAQQLDVGQAGVIIDDCVSEVIARARTFLSARSVANPGHGMTWTLKARMAGGVHVQQISRARRLIASGGLTRRTRDPREAMTMQHLPHRRVRVSGPAGHKPWSPPGVPPGFTDALLLDRVQQSRAAPRTAGTVEQPDTRSKLANAGIQPSMPPAMSCRHRDTEAASGLSQRHPIHHRLRQRQAPSRSELRSTVDLHPGPPRLVSFRRHTAWDEARMPPQPFTTSVGTSPSASSLRHGAVVSLLRAPPTSCTTPAQPGCGPLSAATPAARSSWLRLWLAGHPQLDLRDDAPVSRQLCSDPAGFHRATVAIATAIGKAYSCRGL